MKECKRKVLLALLGIPKWSLTWVERENNKEADSLT
jgi:hypothetical protein